jgi:hypothetical protein
MAEGLPTAGWNSILDWYLGTNFTAWWVQLHIGAPGAAGTTNPAGNTTRQQITSLASAASASKATSSALTWTSVSTAETYSKFSQKDASTAGNFEVSGSVTASAVSVGDTFTIPSGSLTYAGTAAS